MPSSPVPPSPAQGRCPACLIPRARRCRACPGELVGRKSSRELFCQQTGLGLDEDRTSTHAGEQQAPSRERKGACSFHTLVSIVEAAVGAVLACGHQRLHTRAARMTVCANIPAAKVLAWRVEYRRQPAAAAASHRQSFICASGHMELQQCEKELRACCSRAHCRLRGK